MNHHSSEHCEIKRVGPEREKCMKANRNQGGDSIRPTPPSGPRLPGRFGDYPAFTTSIRGASVPPRLAQVRLVLLMELGPRPRMCPS